jgi:hypothetical protein
MRRRWICAGPFLPQCPVLSTNSVVAQTDARAHVCPVCPPSIHGGGRWTGRWCRSGRRWGRCRCRIGVLLRLLSDVLHYLLQRLAVFAVLPSGLPDGRRRGMSCSGWVRLERFRCPSQFRQRGGKSSLSGRDGRGRACSRRCRSGSPCSCGRKGGFARRRGRLLLPPSLERGVKGSKALPRVLRMGPGGSIGRG